MSFSEQLEFGKDGEKLIMHVLQRKNYGVIPSYAYTDNEKQSPRVEFSSRFLIVPDLDCCRKGKRFWVECKRYTKSPWVRVYKANTHGISRRLYWHYLQVQEETGNPVWLVILEHGRETSCGEIENTDVLLRMDLSSAVEPHPCLCPGCRSKQDCFNSNNGDGIKNGVYWTRDRFEEIYTLKDFDRQLFMVEATA